MLETNLLAHIAARSAGLAHAFPWVEVGPGDDCAVIDLGGGPLLLKVDQVVEGRHFVAGTPAPLIARKALGRTLSDIAAMGGEGVCGLAACVLAAGTSQHGATALFDALFEWAQTWRCPIVGGDISTHTQPQGPLTLSISLLGRAHPLRGPVLRSGACAGDSLFVTGRLGGSFEAGTGLGRHLEVTPRVAEGAWLAEHLGPSLHAMMDVSDGLGIDSGRLARASGVRVIIERDAVPLNAGAAIGNALLDGEDYELLFAVASEAAARLPAAFPHTGVPIARIGRIEAPDARGAGAWLIDAAGERDVSDVGWQHG